jgi:hypothetical protein
MYYQLFATLLRKQVQLEVVWFGVAFVSPNTVNGKHIIRDFVEE